MRDYTQLDANIVGAINAGRGILASIENDPLVWPVANKFAGGFDQTAARAIVCKRLQALRKRGLIVNESAAWKIKLVPT